MAKSEAYARISRDVLAMVDAIPEGRVSTYRSLGEHIDVMPRHVAFILATLAAQGQSSVPWHRVVADGGKLSSTDAARLDTQIERLQLEGVEVDASGTITDFASCFAPADALDSGVLRQRRTTWSRRNA